MSEQLPPPSGDQPPALPPPPVYGVAPPGAPMGELPLSQSDERLWAMLAQLGGILIGFLAGLIVMLAFGKRSAFVDSQAKEALNFQITLIIAYVVGVILLLLIVGIFILLAVAILNLVFSILAGVANNKGEQYRYPFILRLVK